MIHFFSDRPGIGQLPAAMALCCLFAVGGCGGYHLRGTVVAGETNGVYVVDANDSRLKTMGIEQAAIELTLDPSTLNPIEAGSTTAGQGGRFDIAIDQMGAGFLEYELGVLCRKQGFSTVWETLALPGGGKRLLIVMVPGRDKYRPKEDILDETLKMIPQ